MKPFTQQINDEIKVSQERISRMYKVLDLKTTFPDLEEKTDRWNNKYYTSSKINSIANEVEFRHSCGCCNDSSLLAFFYKVINGIRVYANPFSIAIGEQNAYGYGEIPWTSWEEILEKHEINSDLFEKVQDYFKNNPPEEYEQENNSNQFINERD